MQFVLVRAHTRRGSRRERKEEEEEEKGERKSLVNILGLKTCHHCVQQHEAVISPLVGMTSTAAAFCDVYNMLYILHSFIPPLPFFHPSFHSSIFSPHDSRPFPSPTSTRSPALPSVETKQTLPPVRLRHQSYFNSILILCFEESSGAVTRAGDVILRVSGGQGRLCFPAHA